MQDLPAAASLCTPKITAVPPAATDTPTPIELSYMNSCLDTVI